MRNTILLFLAIFLMSAAGNAQTTVASAAVSKQTEVKPAPTATPDATAKVDVSDGSPEAEAILPYYSNYLKEYRLGPNDIISIEVFSQCPDYCKTGITVPPTARISYPLVRDGVMVGGRTVEEVAADITKKLDEFIIDPKVTVTLDKAMSARYSVLGKVVSPGVRVLDRKISVYEAVVESGGVSKDGDMKKVVIYSYNGQGRMTSRQVNLKDIQAGRVDMIFVNPGDQIFVAGKAFSLEKVFEILSKVSMARMLFGVPF